MLFRSLDDRGFEMDLRLNRIGDDDALPLERVVDRRADAVPHALVRVELGDPDADAVRDRGVGVGRRHPHGPNSLGSDPVPRAELAGHGDDLTIVGCDAHGIVRVDEIESAIRPDTVLVSVMHANNEIGTIQPIAEIAALCHERNVLVHTDASQSGGKIRTPVDELQVDFLTLAGHKLYAPKGVGALYIRRGLGLEPLMHGAGHEGGLRAGTENVASIVGLGYAASLASKGLDQTSQRMESLRDRLYDQLREEIGSGLRIHGVKSPRLPNTLSVAFPEVTGAAMLSRLPELCASTGSACHSNATSMSDRKSTRLNSSHT